MIKLEFLVSNPAGIHARPAQALVKCCQEYQSEIKLFHEKGCVDPKSIFSILGAAIKEGSKIKFEIEGADEEEAAYCLTNFFENLID